MSHNYWLLKSEGHCYNIDDLKKDRQTSWTGIRNYQARNFMARDMKIGDTVFFYHSNGDTQQPTGIYGLARVCRLAHPDKTQFDKNDEHFDSKAIKEKPIWYCVDIAFLKKFKQFITLSSIKQDEKLIGMLVREVGSRLSIQPVLIKHGKYLLSLSK